MKKFLSVVAILMLLSMCLVGCSNNGNGEDTTTTSGEESKAEGNNNADTQTLASADGKFEVTADSSWKAMTGELNDEAEIEIADVTSERYIIALMEKKADLALTLDEYTDLIVSQMSTNITDANASEKEAVTINGNNGYLTKVEGTVDIVKITYWVYTIENDEYLGQVIGWTLNSKADENEQSIKDVINTFKIN